MLKNESDTKSCNKCKRDLPIEEFGKNARYCKDCTNAYSQAYYAKNKVKINEDKKKKREENPEKAKEYGRKYREKNKDKIRENHRQWQLNNPEKVREYNERWEELHPEQYLKKRDKWLNGPSIKDLDRLIEEGKLKPLDTDDEPEGHFIDIGVLKRLRLEK
jgi:hypothetical protein